MSNVGSFQQHIKLKNCYEVYVNVEYTFTKMARSACGGRLAVQAAISSLIVAMSLAHVVLKPGDDIPFGNSLPSSHCQHVLVRGAHVCICTYTHRVSI